MLVPKRFTRRLTTSSPTAWSRDRKAREYHTENGTSEPKPGRQVRQRAVVEMAPTAFRCRRASPEDSIFDLNPKDPEEYPSYNAVFGAKHCPIGTTLLRIPSLLIAARRRPVVRPELSQSLTPDLRPPSPAPISAFQISAFLPRLPIPSTHPYSNSQYSRSVSQGSQRIKKRCLSVRSFCFVLQEGQNSLIGMFASH